MAKLARGFHEQKGKVHATYQVLLVQEEEFRLGCTSGPQLDNLPANSLCTHKDLRDTYRSRHIVCCRFSYAFVVYSLFYLDLFTCHQVVCLTPHIHLHPLYNIARGSVEARQTRLSASPFIQMGEVFFLKSLHSLQCFLNRLSSTEFVLVLRGCLVTYRGAFSAKSEKGRQ